MISLAKNLLFLPICLVWVNFSWCQVSDRPMDQYDSTYIGSYSTELTGRLYTSRKFSRYGLKDRDENFKLIYKTNENQILGFGATYKFFTLNIGLNFPFVNNDDDIYGESRYLDVQSQAYFRRYMIDMWLSLYKGYYIDQPADRLSNWSSNNEFPMRPEMVNTTFGGTILRLLNSSKFSYRAAFVQDEWQKRSAGPGTGGIVGSDYMGQVARADGLTVAIFTPPIIS